MREQPPPSARATPDGTVPFGEGLRAWRQRRALSQLELAARADVSQRHISFLETSKSTPSRQMASHLARTLDLTQRDENGLLLAAGFAPAFGERRFDDLGDVGDAIGQLLAAHEPNMAIIVDRHWNLVHANHAALAFTAELVPQPPLLDEQLNIMYLMFHPDGLRKNIQNFPAVGAALLDRLRRDWYRSPDDDRLGKLVERVESMASGHSQRLPKTVPQSLVTTIDFRISGSDISLFSVLTSIEGANDVTVAELRLETFLPADRQSRDLWNERFGSSRPRPNGEQ